jgi:hypothetical protein
MHSCNGEAFEQDYTLRYKQYSYDFEVLNMKIYES